jgi:hypothetical protein
MVAKKQTEPASLGKNEKLQYYFCAQFPLKKVLLLLCKVLLTSLGGCEELHSISVFSFP